MSEDYTTGSRQFTDLTAGEVSDLGGTLVHHLAVELQRVGVAGSNQADQWELAEKIRGTIHDHHRAATRRTRK